MNYGNLNEKAIEALKEIGCTTATTVEQALDYIEGAFVDYANPIGIDDEDNPTELELICGSKSDFYELKDYASVEEMCNALIIDACYKIEDLANDMWNDEHTAYYRDTCCGNYSYTPESDCGITECVLEYYGRL